MGRKPADPARVKGLTKTQLVKQLKEQGLWEKRFDMAVNKLFEIEELIEVSRRSILEDGINIISSRGSKKNPAVDFLSALFREWRFYADMLKLSPKSAKTEAKEQEDGFDDI